MKQEEGYGKIITFGAAGLYNLQKKWLARMETVTVTEGIVNIVQLSVEGGLCSCDKMHRFLLPLPPQPKGVAMA